MAQMRSTWIPPEQREYLEYLQDKYGGIMTTEQVGKEIGAKDHRTVLNFMRDSKRMLVGKAYRWRATDVARCVIKAMREE